MIKEHIARRIQELRKEKGLTQTALAQFMNRSRATVSNIESGRQGLDADGLYLVCCALSCTANDLFPAVMPATIERTTKEIEVKRTKTIVTIKIG